MACTGTSGAQIGEMSVGKPQAGPDSSAMRLAISRWYTRYFICRSEGLVFSLRGVITITGLPSLSGQLQMYCLPVTASSLTSSQVMWSGR